MYIPKQYQLEDRKEILEFLKTNNFPALVSFDGGKPTATHLPVEIEEGADGVWTVYGHLARANPQWKSLAGQQVLLIFQGPHTYISPRWYGQANVPTWNYMLVHLYGTVRFLEGEAFKKLLSGLVAKHEVGTGYSLEGLPPNFVQKQMEGIVGIAIDVNTVEASYKLSQNRNPQDHANIILELQNRTDEDSHKIARRMKQNRD